MKIHITGRQMRLTKSIRDYVEEKVGKAQKYFNHIVWAQVLVSVEKRSHQAEIVIHASKQTFRALAKAGDLYAAVDLASDKIDTQLRKYKERLKDRHKTSVPEMESLILEPERRPVRFSVIKQVPLVPMSPEDAGHEMERMGYTFWMFRDEDSGQVNVIYRRLDESFGLLQPAKKAGR
ncbi:MAG: ribosome-associated translation inhibitor RaiA [Elusimicrobiota bacterium]